MNLQATHDALTARARDLRNQAKAVLGRAEAQGREMNPREQANFDRLTAEFDEAANEADRVKNDIENDADLRFAASAGRVVPAQAIGGGQGYSIAQPGDSVHYAGGPVASPRRLPQNNSTAELFGRPAADAFDGKFTSLGDMALAIMSHRPDSRLISNAGMSGGTGSSGGFLVPGQFMGEILDAALEQEVIRPRALVLPMASSSLAAPGFNFLDGTAGKRAGLQLTWTAEGSTLTEQVAAARAVNFSAKKAAILVRVSSELAEDVQAFDRQLRTAMIAAVASGLDLAFMAGGGAGQPLGIIGAPGTVTVSKESGQSAATILLQNLAKMLGRLTPNSYGKAVWMLHPSAIPALYQMTVTIRNVAGTENVGGGSAGVTQSPDGSLRIFGLPVVVSDACSVLGTVGDVVLADLSQYAIGLRRDAIIQRSAERYFESDEVGFRLTLRADAQPLNATPIKLRDGTNTVSPFVVLETR